MHEIEWEKVESLFHEALALPKERREAFLDNACRGDPALHKKVSHLLSHHCQEEQFLKEVDVAGFVGEAELKDAVLQEGRQFGRYEGLKLVGRGGMGEVYVARDSHLKRKVALKILPKGFFTASEEVERLRREAEIVSALEAPNIVTVYDFDKHEGLQFMVTEFVEGVSLRECIGQLSVAHAVNYARQIGEALQAAHTRGIIHRDIKPENIMVRASDDCIKVLDFGLAKLTPSSPETGRSLYERLLEKHEASLHGLVGTVSYMSPEQVREQPVDERTDIWSWGAVFHEMLAGTRPFSAPTTREIFAAILHDQPNPPTGNAGLNRIVSKALFKDLTGRYATMVEALEDLARIPVAKLQPDRHKKFPQRPARSKRWLALAGAVPILAVLVFFGFINSVPSRPFQITKMTRLTASGNVSNAAISPDGKYLAYATQEHEGQLLKILQIGTSAVSNRRPLTSNGYSYGGITFSPDSRFIYYVLQYQEVGTLFRVPLLSGEPELMTTDVDSPISFSPDGKRYVFLREDGNTHAASLLLHSMNDGKDDMLFTIRPKRSFFPAPIWSPDGNSILCGVMDDSGSARRIEIMSVGVTDHQSKTINLEHWQWMYHPAWLKGGRSIAVAALGHDSEFARIWEVFLADGRVIPITNDIQPYNDLDTPLDPREIVAIQVQRASILGMLDLDHPDQYKESSGAGQYLSRLAWTPSGKIISRIDAGGGPEFWEIDPTIDKRQLTFDGSGKDDAVTSLDGQTLIYAAAPEGTLHLWRRRMDGRDQPVRLTSAKAEEHQAAITPDGKWVIYTSTESGFQALWKVPITGGTPIQLTRRAARRPAISPDGKMIACEYSDDPKKGWAVVVLDSQTLEPLRSFPRLPASDNAVPVRWHPNGKSLLYTVTRNGASNLWIQPLDDSSPMQLTHFSSEQIFAFAPSPDGRSLACLRGFQSSDVVLAQVAQ